MIADLWALWLMSSSESALWLPLYLGDILTSYSDDMTSLRSVVYHSIVVFSSAVFNHLLFVDDPIDMCISHKFTRLVCFVCAFQCPHLSSSWFGLQGLCMKHLAFSQTCHVNILMIRVIYRSSIAQFLYKRPIFIQVLSGQDSNRWI